jgi:hypothetical protein
MKWWRNALIATVALLICVGVLGFALHRQITKSSPNNQIEDNKDDKLGTLCGETFGAGAVIIWVIAYKTKGKK